MTTSKVPIPFKAKVQYTPRAAEAVGRQRQGVAGSGEKIGSHWWVKVFWEGSMDPEVIRAQHLEVVP